MCMCLFHNTAMQKCGFCGERMSREKQKRVSFQICDTWFHKKYTQLLGENILILIHFNKSNSLYQPCFVKRVPSSRVNGSPKKNEI